MTDNEFYNLDFLMDLNHMDIWMGRDPYTMSSDTSFEEEELTPDSSPEQTWPDIGLTGDYKLNRPLGIVETAPQTQDFNTESVSRTFYPEELFYNPELMVPLPQWPSNNMQMSQQPQQPAMFQQYAPIQQQARFSQQQQPILRQHPNLNTNTIHVKPSNSNTIINDQRFVQLMPSGKRFAWSQELHESFVSAYESLGESATPKKIMVAMRSAGAQMEGLTRLKVASHFQKYLQKIGRKNCSRRQRSGPALFTMGFNGHQELSNVTLSS